MRKLVIESKFYGEFPFHNLMKDEDVPLLDKWIDQAKTSAEADDFWVVVFRINRKGAFAVFDKCLMDRFLINNHVVYKDHAITEFESFFSNNKDVIFGLVQTDGA
jgi:hypothetical protein